MPNVVGISLRTAGKIYYFDPGNERFDRSERVLVETARGLEIGTVRLPPHEVSDEQIVPPLKPVARRASADDLAREVSNRDREANALEICKRLVTKLNLPMRLIDAQLTFDGSHVLIHFLADNRVDFRELVRELAHELRTRIELRQVGVRDEAKLLGGYGICGRHLCCASFLTNFIPVAINTAKEQGLALNPQKISGMCGRLMCCLAYEHECYREIGKNLPRVNSLVATPRGTGKVTKLNVLAHQVEVSLPDVPGPMWFPVSELNFTGSAPAEHACPGCGGADAPLLPSEEDMPLDEPELIAVAVTSLHEEELDAPVADDPTGETRRPRRRRRRKPGAPATQDASANNPQTAPPLQQHEAGAQHAHPRRRRPRNPEAVGSPTTPKPVTEQASSQPNANPGEGGRRRRHRPRRP